MLANPPQVLVVSEFYKSCFGTGDDTTIVKQGCSEVAWIRVLCTRSPGREDCFLAGEKSIYI